MEPPRGMIARWLELLSNFEFRVMHREGTKHANADALSRCEHAPEPNQEMDEESTLCAAMEEAYQPEPHRSDQPEPHRSDQQEPPRSGQQESPRSDQQEPLRSDQEDSTKEEQEKRRRLKEAQDQDETIQNVKKWIEAKKKPSKLDLRSEDLESKRMHPFLKIL